MKVDFSKVKHGDEVRRIGSDDREPRLFYLCPSRKYEDASVCEDKDGYLFIVKNDYLEVDEPTKKDIEKIECYDGSYSRADLVRDTEYGDRIIIYAINDIIDRVNELSRSMK